MQSNLHSYILDSSMAIKLVMGPINDYPEHMLIDSLNIWHEFKVIKGALYDKEDVLKGILNSVEPAHLLPVKYQVRGEDSYFIANNCGPAIESLCRSSLIIKIPDGNHLILTIVLGFALVTDLTINIQPLLLNTLTKRYDFNKKLLDLEAFHKDADLYKTIYCPLSHQTNLEHILTVAKSKFTTIKYLNLKRNELSILDGLKLLDLNSLKYLDLRYNNLLNMKDLNILQDVMIRKLWLDGNPLCENYSSAKQYISSAMIYCPHIIELDGASVCNSTCPITHNEYFKNNTRRELVYKFVRHFFNLFDQEDRNILKGLYGKQALYSLSFNIPFSVAHKKNLVQYTKSRNILKVTNSNKRRKFLYYGENNILNTINELPKTYHYQNSFQYDLMYEDNERLMISVTGLFMNKNDNNQILSFNRTFVLWIGPDNEYNIINDQICINDAPENQTLINTIIELNDTDSTDNKDFIPECFSPKEKCEIITEFEQISKLKKEWCEQYLLKEHWNLRQSIQNFMIDFKNNALPLDAFNTSIINSR
ncbi:PREDICTED: nuclear RNA export factor 1-like [Polistes dominula]|uniref:Nuclear RNA export factor 1-like n=1 Tax=Polistes dominula TaxID=743375 RepID=A0ABM1I4V6_POLDO|nr:PREDICTED: nuclear RNA export factor 1-like [Polistes dominula]